MKQLLLSAAAFLGLATAQAQHDTVSVYDIQYIDQSSLQNCNDTSSYFGDTVTVAGYVVTPGGYSELASGSSPTGQRPLLNIVDTMNQGAGGPFHGIQIHGYWTDDNSNSITADLLNSIPSGQLVYITGIVDAYNNETQIYPLTNSQTHIFEPGASVPQPKPVSVNVGDLQDGSTNNQLETGEQWEGSYVELTNLTVVSDESYSTPTRRQYICQDANGNQILIYDKFLAMKDGGWTTVNPNSPQSTGPLTPLQVGQVLDTLRGIIDHDANGCLGGGNFSRGYRISPIFESDIVRGVSPAIISNVSRSSSIPTSSDDVTITSDIVDPDGSVANATLYYSTNLNSGSVNFTSMGMTNTGGDTYEATIPAQGDGTTVGYYIEAEDNDGNMSYFPITNAGQQQNVEFYTVRDNGISIYDIQYVPYPSQDDASSFVGEEVTVTGVVTSSMKDYDLGYVHIQDQNATEFGGVMLTGALQLGELQRHEIVTVTGTVVETRELTQINVSSIDEVNATTLDTISPVILDPADTTSKANHGWEKYEGMLVEFQHPGNGKIHVTDEYYDFFGAWMVSSKDQAPEDESSIVMTGIQAAQNFASVYVSVITNDTTQLPSSDAPLEVDPVATDTTQSMDALRGIFSARYEVIKLTPRNNDDFFGFSVPLDSAQLEDTELETGVTVINGNTVETALYPNPASNRLNVRVKGAQDLTTVELYDLSGRNVKTVRVNNGQNQIDIASLQAGVYLAVIKTEGVKIQTEKIIIQ
ncbi:T9SS type A sorting domain-containing protein [Salibacter sp.]|uniref:T9SS type A sorting domain-containing protein n=1 Tax=Salibacter sp. TaxID=2010995 RepID=UPI00286FFB51|nr:T9SS type A sorting domain-containing protein [Salibacter sp.]MDR9399380.1 T9SS type A sorting domain-containing protein [Salibacter sp.]MDR9488246.1 T9SS type A sorting domain-containing protein [Salibacter sp.]